jgi:hypothetical protein
MTPTDIENLAIQLRQAAFPGATGWAFCSEDVRERWIKAAKLADAMIERAKDQALRQATAAAHELGQHAAVKMLRELRAAERVG